MSWFSALSIVAVRPVMLLESFALLGGGVLAGLAGGAAVGFKRRRKSVNTDSAESVLRSRLAVEHANFMAAAESALDAFYIFECARGGDGEIVDFTFRYVNARAEHRLHHDREYLLGRQLCLEIPLIRSQGLFDLYCEVVRTGVAATRELMVNDAVKGVGSVRHHVVKLGDGVAVTSTDRTAYRALEAEFETATAFSDAIFESAPFSIIATDARGVITAMNAQAEALTGYDREELVGRESVLALYDVEELNQRRAELREQRQSAAEHETESAALPEGAERREAERREAEERRYRTRRAADRMLAARARPDQMEQEASNRLLTLDRRQEKLPGGGAGRGEVLPLSASLERLGEISVPRYGDSLGGDSQYGDSQYGDGDDWAAPFNLERMSAGVAGDLAELRADAEDGSGEVGAERSDLRSDLHLADAGRVLAEPREWTYIRRDGTRTPVDVAMKVLRSANGERCGTVSIAQEAGHGGVQAGGNRSLRPTHDALTGLVGRELLEDRIEQAIMRATRTNLLVGVYVLDLDQFKGLNDALGHRIGDEVLALTAKRLVGMLRRSDTVARPSGDEFVVVMSELKDMAAVELCAEKLVRALTPPYVIGESEVRVTVSVGVSVYPAMASSTVHLLERAETAMHAAKQAGRGRFEVFRPEMLGDVSSRLSMESALRGALDRDELYVEYQPQVALPEGRVIGMEALLRWRHPQLGQVSPAHFIPMAEEMGLMPQFGAWAIARACTEARGIQLETGRRLMVSVNLSPYQFEDGRLVESVKSALRISNLAAEDLEIEITENTLMVNSTANLAMLQQIREMGVRLSIDDFGTGFSSFSYLLQYKVDRLKIDQSFVRQASVDANAASVVRTIIAMSHGLGIKVIAEGVETRDQLKLLLRRHCDEAQGYFFSRPVGVERFAAMVEQIEALKFQTVAFEAGVGAGESEEEMEHFDGDEAPKRPLQRLT